jgi:hypothetical protein
MTGRESQAGRPKKQAVYLGSARFDAPAHLRARVPVLSRPVVLFILSRTLNSFSEPSGCIAIAKSHSARYEYLHSFKNSPLKLSLKMNFCVLCKSKLSRIEKPEHILLNALGGRKTTRNVLCSNCNNKMGAGPDKDLADSVSPLRTIASLKSGSGKNAPSMLVKPISGELYKLNPEGVPFPINKEPLKFGLDEAGNETISITARDESHLEQLLEAAAKARKMTQEVAERFKETARNEAVITSKPASKFEGQIQFGSGRSRAAMAKACLVLWAEMVGNAEACNERYDEIRNFILSSNLADSEEPESWVDTRELPQLPDGFSGNTNMIWVGSNVSAVSIPLNLGLRRAALPF